MSSTDRLQSADWLTLSGDERIEWNGRPSLFTLAPRIIAAALVGLLGGVGVSLLSSLLGWSVPGVITAVPLLAALGSIAVVVLGWYRIQYVITSREVYIKRGFISLTVDQIRIARIQNTQLSQSMVERLLGYGDVIAYTAGSDTKNIEFNSVPNPSRVNETLSRLLSRPENDPVEI